MLIITALSEFLQRPQENYFFLNFLIHYIGYLYFCILQRCRVKCIKMKAANFSLFLNRDRCKLLKIYTFLVYVLLFSFFYLYNHLHFFSPMEVMLRYTPQINSNRRYFSIFQGFRVEDNFCVESFLLSSTYHVLFSHISFSCNAIGEISRKFSFTV